jgi:hypothetical protein
VSEDAINQILDLVGAVHLVTVVVEIAAMRESSGEPPIEQR